MDEIYNNTGYRNTRNRKQILILDISDEGNETHLGAGGVFNVELFEPLKIDSLSEVYLDNFVTFNNNISNNNVNSAFVLKINEFNINSNVASSDGASRTAIFNSIIIPNEHNTTANNHSAILHKAKKFNYVCDINPGKIGRISGKITNLKGEPIFHGTDSTHIYTYALTGIANALSDTGGNVKFPLENNMHVTLAEIADHLIITGGSTANCIFLATHTNDASVLHFSSDKVIKGVNLSEAEENIIFTHTSSDTYIIDNGTIGDNPNLLLVANPGRFIAEFSIVSRE